jgi:polyphosphate kinase 2 (PPK2 family)
MINDFEAMLAASATRILKFYLHISPKEQLSRFRRRLEDPERQWKISENDYTERQYWDAYIDAYEDALEKTSTESAPWFVIPSDHKWYRNLAIAEVIAKTLKKMNLHTPPVRVDLVDIKRRFHSLQQGPNGERGEP